MRRGILVVATSVLLLAGAGIALAVLWITGTVWSDSDEVRQSFCSDLSQWHDTQSAFLKRTNEEGSRERPGLATTNDLFQESARLALPAAESDAEAELRTLVREVTRFEEQWLSELGIVDSLTGPSSTASTEQRVASYRRAEELRVSLNDALREANARLEAGCELTPLPLYT